MDTADECESKVNSTCVDGVDGAATAVLGGGDAVASAVYAKDAAPVAADSELAMWFACTGVAAVGDRVVAASSPTERIGAGLIVVAGEGCSEGNSIDTETSWYSSGSLRLVVTGVECSEGNSIDTETSWYSSGSLRLVVTGVGCSEGNSIDTETSWYSSGSLRLVVKEGGVAMRDGARVTAVLDGCSAVRSVCVVLLDGVAGLGRGTVSRAKEGITAADLRLADRCGCGRVAVLGPAREGSTFRVGCLVTGNSDGLAVGS